LGIGGSSRSWVWIVGGLGLGRSSWRVGRFCDQHNPGEQSCVIGGAQQYIIEVRSIEEFGDYFSRGTWPEVSGDALSRSGRNFDLG
jgi:hypothetical protein